MVGSDNGALSPWDGVSSPIIQTPDQKTWIDLELLNPKFLKGLSQYAPSIRDEPNSKLGKGAAKIKAWARQSKAGIDIRLRRKINNEKDEITDIRLVPDAYPPDFASTPEKPPFAQELPAMRSIAELADTAPAMELDATQSRQPSRSSTSSTLGEPLPRYERNPASSTSDVATNSTDLAPPASTPPDASADGMVREVSPIGAAEFRHRPSTSQSSIVATPTRGLSLRDAPESPPTVSDAKSDSDQYATLLKADLEDANKKLGEEREMSESLQAIIRAISEEHSRQQVLSDGLSGSVPANKAKDARLNRLKVANRTTYETETEHEPPSPPTSSRRRTPAPARRKKSVTFPSEGKSRASSSAGKALLSDSSDDEPDAAAGTLIRKQTLPKRVPATAGVEAVWRSLIRMQTILLGPDHRFTIQAKSDLRARRTNDKREAIADLTALEQSKIVADRDFGREHPWVAAFTEDLEKLRSLTKPLGDVPGDQAPTARRKGSSGSPLLAHDAKRSSNSNENAFQTPEVRITAGADQFSSAGEPSLHRIDTSVPDQLADNDPSPVVGGVEIDSQLDMMWNTSRLPHQPANNHVACIRLGFAAVSRVAWSGIDWLQQNYGPERPVEHGKTRVRWTCSCGEKLHDDFIEKRPGAARALEAYLNRPKGAALASRGAHTKTGQDNEQKCNMHETDTFTGPANNGGSPTTVGSSPGNNSFGSSFDAPPSSQTSFSNHSFPNNSWPNDPPSKMHPTWSTTPSHLPFSPTYEPPWLLTCATEDRFTPKVTHLDMSPHKIHSDKDLAISLRKHYFHVNKKWWRALRLRGLTTIEFVQFEVHQNRFADIRKVPDVPLKGRGEYNFEPSDLLPPVGSHYLLHLFKHPEDYDGELITYLRSPKKNGRLQLGVGWGINLVEGFLADKVWIWMSAMFALGSLVFGVLYAVKRHDVQGAFGVAAWIVTLGALAAGWLQACLG